jgi:flagellar assembly factor FliW
MGHNNQMDLEETESIVVVWVLLVQDSSTEMVINRRAPEKY